MNRYPPISGLKDVNFFGLRNLADYEKITQEIRKDGVKNITIIGGGFIGMETASAIKAALKDQVNVTVIEGRDVPLSHVLGTELGNVLSQLAAKNGVNVITSANIKEIRSDNRAPKAVVLYDREVPSDVLIMATGVKTSMDFAKDLLDRETHGIKTNVFLETVKKDVYASGDVASYPYWFTGKNVRIEHYNEAIYQGSVAALNMMGKKYPMDNIPFFWTRQFNNSLLFTGYTQGWDEVHITGSLEDLKFVAYYINKKDDRILGAAAMNSPNQIQIINEAMKNGTIPRASLIKAGEVTLEQVYQDTLLKRPKCSRCNKASE